MFPVYCRVEGTVCNLLHGTSPATLAVPAEPLAPIARDPISTNTFPRFQDTTYMVAVLAILSKAVE
jgi:hypothetical protein